MIRRFRTAYGAGPAHLVVMLACGVVAIYAATKLLADRPVGTAVWYAGSAVLHDLLVLPVYVLADSALVALWRRHPTLRGRGWLGHVRFPAAISVLLLVVFSPEIFRYDGPYYGDSNLSSGSYLDHWLIVVAVLCALSALTLAVRLVRRSSP
jgi:hypothetical protein